LKKILDFKSWILEKEERDEFYKKELNPKFWSGETFDPSIRTKLLSIAKDFSDALKIEVPIVDIQLTGSLANYNWTEKSDLDVHVLIDFKKIDTNEDLVKQSLDGLRFIWNLRHNVVLRGHDVELYVQDVEAPHTASGLYSLLRGEWIRVPKYNKPEIDYKDVDLKFKYFVDEITNMENLVNTSDFSQVTEKEIYNRAQKLKKKIIQTRREGLAEGGEFSVENLVFKKLRNEGYIEKIIDLISKAYTNIYNEQENSGHVSRTKLHL
jgi:hypothetical protein